LPYWEQQPDAHLVRVAGPHVPSEEVVRAERLVGYMCVVSKVYVLLGGLVSGVGMGGEGGRYPDVDRSLPVVGSSAWRMGQPRGPAGQVEAVVKYLA